MSLHICNAPEDFTREIRHILLFDYQQLTFNKNLNGLPPEGNFLLKIDLHNPTPFQRKIDFKTQHNTDFYDVKITIPIYDVSPKSRLKLFGFHKRKKYVMALVSAQETLILGNHREPFSLLIDDNIKDDGSGKDFFNVTITGQTLIFPSTNKITEPFRVLLFVPPLE